MSDTDALEARLSRLEARIDRLEGARDRVAPSAAAPRAAELSPGKPSLDATLIGKSVLIIGGGYVLRALTEMGILPETAGILLGLLYSLAWMIIASRAMSRGRTSAALFDAATAALIASGLIWEATARFHLLTSPAAGAIVLTMTLALLLIAWRRRSAAFALIATIMVTVTCIGVAIATADLRAPLLAATIAGVVISSLSIKLRWPAYLTLLVAAATDTLAIPLIAMVAIAQTPPPVNTVEIVLLAFAALWLVVPLTMHDSAGPQLGQAIVATLIGTGGAAIVAAFHSGHPVVVGVVCLVISAVSYAVASKHHHLAIPAAIAAAVGTVLLFAPAAVTIVWAAAAAASAIVARRLSWSGANVHTAAWAVGAAVAAGLPQALVTASGPSIGLVIAGVVAALALWSAPLESKRSRFALLTIATAAAIIVAVGGISGFTTDRAVLAMTRTAALAIAAVVLVAIRDKVPEAKSLSIILLVITGVKVLFEDLRAGRAVTIVIALALYGGALVLVASRRMDVRSDATTGPQPGSR